jgi:hypothetical protein
MRPSVNQVIANELAMGMNTAAFYLGFQAQAVRIARELNAFLIASAQKGERVVAYGAAAKGNTLLNFAGVRSHLLSYVVDRNPSKQGKFLPGSRIPVRPVACLTDDQPDAVLILPWNLEREICQELEFVKAWHAKVYVVVPRLRQCVLA